eukprot:TRINITY_DN2022_c0_g1_i2.p1 TRINITY_DN2022_c0_g1~~TRINITY_DN2022_c0_g1_i2.p1  ORF type:complete len:2327 (-),score=597.02 TRINITY_DN2022_c0_g1_i2:124-7104(-)
MSRFVKSARSLSSRLSVRGPRKGRREIDPYDAIPPNIFLLPLNWVEENAIDVKNIFQISGAYREVEKFLKQFEHHNKTIVFPNDPHVIAGALKLWLCQLPVPLLTFELYDDFIAAQELTDCDERLRRLRDILSQLPPGNSAVVTGFMRLLNIIHEHSDVNNMASNALAIIFAPALLRSRETDLQMMLANADTINKLSETLIVHYPALFGVLSPKGGVGRGSILISPREGRGTISSGSSPLVSDGGEGTKSDAASGSDLKKSDGTPTPDDGDRDISPTPVVTVSGTQDTTAKTQWTLNDVLSDDNAIQLFMNFLTGVSADVAYELEFWCEVESYRPLQKSTRFYKARELFDSFIKGGSPKHVSAVNIDSRITIAEAVSQNSVPSNLFDSAQSAVLKKLEGVRFLDFKRMPEYEELCTTRSPATKENVSASEYSQSTPLPMPPAWNQSEAADAGGEPSVSADVANDGTLSVPTGAWANDHPGLKAEDETADGDGDADADADADANANANADANVDADTDAAAAAAAGAGADAHADAVVDADANADADADADAAVDADADPVVDADTVDDATSPPVEPAGEKKADEATTVVVDENDDREDEDAAVAESLTDEDAALGTAAKKDATNDATGPDTDKDVSTSGMEQASVSTADGKDPLVAADLETTEVNDTTADAEKEDEPQPASTSLEAGTEGADTTGAEDSLDVGQDPRQEDDGDGDGDSDEPYELPEVPQHIPSSLNSFATLREDTDRFDSFLGWLAGDGTSEAPVVLRFHQAIHNFSSRADPADRVGTSRPVIKSFLASPHTKVAGVIGEGIRAELVATVRRGDAPPRMFEHADALALSSLESFFPRFQHSKLYAQWAAEEVPETTDTVGADAGVIDNDDAEVVGANVRATTEEDGGGHANGDVVLAGEVKEEEGGSVKAQQQQNEGEDEKVGECVVVLNTEPVAMIDDVDGDGDEAKSAYTYVTSDEEEPAMVDTTHVSLEETEERRTASACDLVKKREPSCASHVGVDSLTRIVGSPLALASFKEFLLNNQDTLGGCALNLLLFWVSVKNYNAIPMSEERVLHAKDIYFLYLDEDARFRVVSSGGTGDAAAPAAEAPATGDATSEGESIGRVTEKIAIEIRTSLIDNNSTVPGLFNKAQEAAFVELGGTAYKAFLNSRECAAFVHQSKRTDSRDSSPFLGGLNQGQTLTEMVTASPPGSPHLSGGSGGPLHLLHDDRLKSVQSLESVLVSPQALEMFRDYLEKEHSSENLLFYDSVSSFRTLDESSRRARAEYIMSSFVDPMSASQVNLDQEVIEEIHEKLEAVDEDVPIDIFDDAVYHIVNIMRTHSHPRFRRSAICASYLKDGDSDSEGMGGSLAEMSPSKSPSVSGSANLSADSSPISPRDRLKRKPSSIQAMSNLLPGSKRRTQKFEQKKGAVARQRQLDVDARKKRERCISSLSAVLGSPLALKYFKQYLAQEFSAENLMFWQEVKDYRSIAEAEQRLQKAQELHDLYIADDSKFQVNLDIEHRRLIKTQIDDAEAALHSNAAMVATAVVDESTPAATIPSENGDAEESPTASSSTVAGIGADLFDAAQSSSYQLMETHSYPRFIRSSHCKKLLELLELEADMFSSPEDRRKMEKRKKDDAKAKERAEKQLKRKEKQDAKKHLRKLGSSGSMTAGAAGGRVDLRASTGNASSSSDSDLINRQRTMSVDAGSTTRKPASHQSSSASQLAPPEIVHSSPTSDTADDAVAEKGGSRIKKKVMDTLKRKSKSADEEQEPVGMSASAVAPEGDDDKPAADVEIDTRNGLCNSVDSGSDGDASRTDAAPPKGAEKEEGAAAQLSLSDYDDTSNLEDILRMVTIDPASLLAGASPAVVAAAQAADTVPFPDGVPDEARAAALKARQASAKAVHVATVSEGWRSHMRATKPTPASAIGGSWKDHVKAVIWHGKKLDEAARTAVTPDGFEADALQKATEEIIKATQSALTLVCNAENRDLVVTSMKRLGAESVSFFTTSKTISSPPTQSERAIVSTLHDQLCRKALWELLNGLKVAGADVTGELATDDALLNPSRAKTEFLVAVKSRPPVAGDESITAGATPPLMCTRLTEVTTADADGVPVHIYYDDGSRYEGTLKNGECHGEGTFVFPTGDEYSGRFVEGRIHGFGTLLYAKKDVYEGFWREDVRHGFGVYTASNGDRYRGEYLDGVRQGYGSYVMHGGSCFRGQYDNGLPNGSGLYVFENGDVYEGEFVEDMFHGHGFYHGIGGVAYAGAYVDGKKHGFGRYVTEKNDVYLGEFIEDMMEGHGDYSFAHGDMYSGQFGKGKFNGKGTYTFGGGEKVEGQFIDGRPV